jgi:SOS-response transcriptional repressor LexA
MGMDRVLINRVIQGKRKLTSVEMLQISQLLNYEMPRAISGKNVALTDVGRTATLRYIPVVGEVAGGVWKEMNYVDFDEFEIPYLADPRWPEEAVKALRVKGESINRQARDGDFAAVLDAHIAPREARPGDWVVVHRQRGDLVESTVKRVEEIDGRLMLVPDSTDPRFQAPLPLADASGTEEVRIVAFVLDFIRPATRF